MQPAIACIANPNKIKTNVSKKKSLTRVVWAFVFLIFALPETSFANVVITAPSLTLTACGSFPTSYSALGNIVITEGSNGDFATGNNKTLILTAPANFEFQAGIGSVSFLGGANLSNTSITVTTTTITVQYDVNNNNRHDVLTISGINVRGITAAASNRTVTRTGGTGTITADVNGTVHATLTSQLVSIPSVTTPTAQSSCSGSATNIALASSPSGASFTWTLGTVTNASGAVAGSGTNIAQTLTSTGTPSSVQYIVTPTLNGCTGSSTTITNTINPKPNMTSASTATVCSGATVSIGLTSDISSSYTWVAANNPNTTGESTSTQSSSTLSNTITNNTTSVQTVSYTVIPTATATGCIGASQTVTVTVNPKPVAGAITGTSSPICIGSTITLNSNATGTAPLTYTWSSSNNLVATVNNSGVVTAVGAGTADITYTVTDGNGCSATSAPYTVTVSAPTGSLTATETSGTTNNDNIICTGAAVVFTATSGYPAYTFKVNGTTVQSGTSNIYSSSTLTNGASVTVDVANSLNCGATFGPVVITVNPLPTGTLTATENSGTPNDNTICPGANVAFTAPVGFSSYSFKVNGSTVQGGSSNTFSTTTLTGSASITVDVINANGCVATLGPQVITVNAAPAGTLTATETSGSANNDDKICAGDNITFTATSGFSSYNFRVNGTSVQTGVSNTFSTNTLTNGSFVTVDVVNSNGCTSTFGPLVITVSALPTGTLTATENSGTPNNNTICAGANVTFTATAGFANYNFKVNGVSVQNGVSNTFSSTTLANNDNVSVVVRNANGCERTLNTVTITVIALPTGTLTAAENSLTPNDNIICAGANVTFTATAGFSNYNFKVNGTSVQNSASNTFNTTTLTNGASVTVNVTNASGCLSTFGPVVITVNALPAGTLSFTESSGTVNNDGIICAGDNVTFTATAGFTNYNFKVNGTSVQNGASNIFSSTTLTNGASITADVTNGNGCVTTFNAIVISVKALPAGTLTATENSGTPNDNIICAGANVTFTATGGFTNYDFKVNGTSVQSGATNTFSSTALTNGASVTVDVANADGCISTFGPVTITVNALPAGTLTVAETSGVANNDNIICAGDNVSFTVTPGFGNYNFKVNGTSVQNGASKTFSSTTLANGASVTVDVTNANGCVSTLGPVIITVNPLPVVAAITGSTNVCMNSTTALSDATAGGVWSSNDITIATVNPSTGVVTPVAPGTVIITYTVTTNGCSSSVNTTVTVNDLPSPTLTGPNPICLGATGNVYTTESGQFNYVWNVVNGTVTAGGSSTSNTITISWLAPGLKSINVNYSDANGCTGATSATVVNSSITAPTITGPTVVCLNSTGNVYTTETGNTNYTWNVTGGTITSGGTILNHTATITWNTSGTKSVSVNYTDINGCNAASPTILPVTVKPLPTATISGNATVCRNGTAPVITFTGAAGTAPYTFSYKINGVNQSPVTTTSGSSVTINAPTSTAGTFVYTLVSVSDNFSCSQNQAGTVTIIVNPASNGGSVSANATVCSGSNSGTLNLTGQTGSVIRWESSTNGGTTWSTIANTTTSLTYINLTQTTLFRAVVQSGVCASANSSAATITVNPNPTANAGPALPAICQGGTSAALNGSVGGVATGGIWSTPAGGTFNPNATTLNATWTPPAAFTGTATLTLTTTGGSCGTASASKTIVVNSNPTVNVGPAIAAICQANTSAALGGSVGGGATGGTWSSPDGGTFNPGATTLNATWTPPAAFSGTATLTLTTTGGSCGTVSASKTIVVNPQPPTTGVTICQGGSGSLTSSAGCAAPTSGADGPNLAGTGATSGGTGDAWSNPTRINANDNSYATANINNRSEALNATQFAFAIPANAIIDGIQATISRFSSNSNSLQDNSVRLLKGGVAVGNNNGATSTNWPTAVTAANYGSTSDLWGTTWTPADINANNFGVALIVDNNNTNNRTASVDYITITITYTIPGTLNWYTVSSGGTAIGNGSPFNPVGVAGSGLANTNTPGTYTFYAECLSFPGCRTATNFVINPISTLSSSLTPPARCNNVSGTYTATSATAGTTFSWSRAAVAGISNPAASGSGATITETLVNTTTSPVNVVYAITLTAPPPGNCPNTQNVTVTINPTPTLSSSLTPAARCSGTSGTYTATSAIAGTTFSWSRAAVAGISNAAASGNGATITETLVNTTTNPVNAVYAITMTANGCSNTQNVTVTINPTPVVTIFADYCAVAGKVRLTASSSPTGATFVWSTGQTGSTIDVDVADFYTVTGTLGTGCSATASISVAQELVVNGDFESGNTGFTSDYTYKPDLAGLVPAGQGELYDDSGNNGYSITPDGQNVHVSFWGQDHTSRSGNFMAVNGHGNSLVVWKQTVNVLPNTTYYFSSWAMSLNSVGPFAQLQFSVNGTLIGTTAVLNAGVNNNNNGYTGTAVWTRFYGTWTSGPTTTTADIYVNNLQAALGGNDFGLDDISFGTLNTFIRLESAAGTDAQTVCANSPITDIVYSVGSSSTGPTVTGLPPGLTTSFNGVYLYITGSPTTTGTFAYTVTTTGTCNPSSATGTITVQSESLNLSSGSTSQTRCINNAISPIVFAVGGTATGASVTGLPSGVTGVYNSGTFAISGTPTVGGTFNYTVTTTGSCQSATATGTITVNVPPTANLSGSQTTCNGEAATLTIAVTGTGTISGTLSDGTSFSGTAPTILVNVNPVITTTYTISTLTNGTGCAATSMTGSATVTVPSGAAGLWTGAAGNDWFNCRNWANGKVPTASIDVTINNTASSTVVIDLSSPYAATYSYVATARNITVNNNSMSFGSTNDSLFAAGTLTIQNNGIINMATGGKIELQGNWNDQVNTAGKGFLNGTGTVIFSGAANQTITAVKGTELFYNLKINKTSTTGLVVLNNNITVDYDLTLTRGIFVTGYNLFTWNNNGGTLSSPGSGPGGSGSGLYTDSYIATSEGSGTPINVGGPTTPFAANAGFKIKNVGNTNTYFPVGASYLSSTTGQPPSPNRMMINNPGVPQDFTVAVNYGDIGFTNGGAGALKVNRIWYVKGSLGTGMVNMQLFFTKRDWTGWGTNENEVESGFDYTQPALVQKDYSGNQNNFINLSSTGDITSFAGAPYNTEIYGKYTIGISSTLTNGIQQFNRFSIVNPSSIILPVKFVGFKAYQNGNEVRIDWTAVNEINVHHYEIEKSTDGVRFTTIDRVDIIKNSTYANYRKTDPSPAFGNNFYRIRAIDKDGAVTYTSIELVNIAGKTYVTIYPNPVQNGIVNLYFTNLPAGNYDFILYNTLGQPILNRKIEHQGGSATQSFRLPTNAISGSYIVKLLNNTFDFTGRIVID